MLNQITLNRYLSYFIAVLFLVLAILSLVWLNFQYTRFSQETAVFRAEQESDIRELTRDKALVLENQADKLYYNVEYTMRDNLQARGLTIGNLLAVSNVKKEDPTILFRLGINGNEIQKSIGINQYITDLKGTAVGAPIEGYVPKEDGQVELFRNYLVYSDKSPDGRLHYYVYYDTPALVDKQMSQNFGSFYELDPHIQIFDRDMKNVNTQGNLSWDTENFDKNYIWAAEKSLLTDYTFGYFYPKSELEALVEQKRADFKDYLKYSILEIGAFIVLFSVSFLILVRYISRRLDRNAKDLNDSLIEAYENRLSIHENKLFEHFPLSKSIDYILNDSKHKEINFENERHDYEQKYKQQRIEILQQRRKINMISQTGRFTSFILNQSSVKLSIREILQQQLETYVRSDAYEVDGDDGEISSDLQRVTQLLIETIGLSQDPRRNYHFEVLSQQTRALVYVTITDIESIDEDSLQRIKDLAKQIGGMVQRISFSNNILNLVLSIPSL